MNSQLWIMVGTWSVFLVAYVILLTHRKQMERSEDETLHVLADSRLVSMQEAIAHKLEVLDRWSKILLAVVIVYGLAIAGYYLYSVWQSNLNATL